MKPKRIIPCLDVRNGRVVKGEQFQNIVDVDDPVVLAQRYCEAGADELVLYDITASHEGRSILLEIVEKVAKHISIPFTVGGGIETIDDFEKVLHAGADKVSINSSAAANPQLIREASQEFGSQCVVLSIDVKKTSCGNWHVFTRGGRQDTGMDAVEWAKKGAQLGAGEIVLNVMDTDGVKTGYSLEITRTITEAVPIPVTASGGAGTKEHFLEVLTEGKADAALAASVFHFGQIQIPELKKYLLEHGVDVRRERNGL